MPHQPKSIVFDSWAIIAYLEDEPAGKKVADVISEANEHQTMLLMSVVNASEVWYILARGTSKNEADKALDDLISLGIRFIDADWNLAHRAARFKGKHTMSLADAFAAALAQQEKGAVLLTGDKEFTQVEREVKIMWVGN
jgi:uncharacterized protein